MPEDATIYLVCPTKTDRALAPEGHDIIKILPHIPYIQDPPFTRQDYDALKERQYDKLERMGLVDLRKHIVLEHVLTPDDLQRMYYSNRGAIYGVVSNRKKNYALKAPKQSSKYRNLYFVGGSVNPGGGTPMVVLSGQKAAELIVRNHG
jgi:diapolycopene oxygenase